MKYLIAFTTAAAWLTVVPFPVRAIWGTSLLGAAMFVTLTGLAFIAAVLAIIWRDSAPEPPPMQIMRSQIIDVNSSTRSPQ